MSFAQRTPGLCTEAGPDRVSNSHRTCGSILFSRVLASEKLSIFVEEEESTFAFFFFLI